MKRHRVKKCLRQPGKTGVLFSVIGLILDGFFLNKSFADSPPGKPAIASSSNDFIETILERSLETSQFIWAKLKGLLDSNPSDISSSLFKMLEEKPLVLAGVALMIAGAFFIILRSRKIKAEQRRVLTDLQESLGDDEDDYEGNRPLFSGPSQTEEDLDDEARPLFSHADAEGIGSEGDEESEEVDILQMLEKESEEDDSSFEETTAADPPLEETEDNEILKKLEEEFAQLENEFQDADTLREEVAESTQEEEGLPEITSSDIQEGDEGDSLRFVPIDAMQEEVVGEDETYTDDELPQSRASDEDDESDEDNESDQSLVDLQMEMEQTVQELSEQLEEKNEETLFDKSSTESSPEKEPTTANDLTNILGSTEITVSEEITLAPGANEPELIVQQEVDVPSPEATAEHSAIDSQPTVEQESEPPTEKKTHLDPEIARRRINQLVNFQKNLEEQLDKMNVLERKDDTEETTSVHEEIRPEDFALQPATQNYEQTKKSLKQKDSFDLLESFILLANQKKDD